MPNPALKQIATLRGCSVEEARAYCVQVQKLCKGCCPSFKCTAQAVRQLEHQSVQQPEHQSYTLQEIAKLAVTTLLSRPKQDMPQLYTLQDVVHVGDQAP